MNAKKRWMRYADQSLVGRAAAARKPDFADDGARAMIAIPENEA
jgi:hypothetical protein